ncbi:MAG: DUF1643 domain-containing protein [Anaerolineaceae bacterium]
MEGGACFDSSGAYRYRLWRAWEPALPIVTFVMLNPSSADAERDDPTIRRCIGFARSWGFGRLQTVNLCAYRATSPRALLASDDPFGPENEQHLLAALANADLVIAAWGNHGRSFTPPTFDQNVHHLGLTTLGQPRHPLYVRGETRLVPWITGQSEAQTP